MTIASTHSLCFLAVLLSSIHCAKPVTLPECSETLNSLGKLQAAALMSRFSRDDVVCVSLPPVDYVNYTDTTIQFNVVLIGNASVVLCNEPVKEEVLELSVYTHFPLIFSNSSFVYIIGDVHFRGCRRPIQFRQITQVQLSSVSFSDFYPAGAVEISNSPIVTVDGCTFTNGTSLGIGKERYSGNSGGLSIGYDNYTRPPNLKNTLPMITISQSIFTKNTAKATEGFIYTVSEVIDRRVYNQRGGGVALYLGAPDYNATISVSNCAFDGNVVSDSGGGIYMFLSGENSAHQVKIIETIFTCNEAKDGGGLEITHIADDSINNPNDILVQDCTFTGNLGNFGGAYKNIQLDTKGNLNRVNIVNTTFSGNKAPVGAALYLQSLFTLVPVQAEERIVINNCTLFENQAERGVVLVIRNSVGIQGNSTFQRSIGPALRIVGSIVSLGGNITFEDNQHHPEGFSGTLHVSSYGQILLHSGANITFMNNTGIEGAAIVVKGQLIADPFTKQLYNPQCFLQYEPPKTRPEEWKVHMLFENNRAVSGPVIYASDLDICEWYNVTSPFFSDENANVWSFMELRDNYLIRSTNVVNEDYYFQTDIDSILLNTDQLRVQAIPGKPVKISAVALDEHKHETSGFLQLEIAAMQNLLAGDVSIEPSIIQSVAGKGEIEFIYRSVSDSRKSDITVDVNAPFVIESVPSVSFTIEQKPCLPGYTLHNKECTCVETERVTLCDPKGRGILLAIGLWGAPTNWSSNLTTYTCPAGYCNCVEFFKDLVDDADGCLLNYNDPFSICQTNRTGLLCGQCKEGYGVGLLLNMCREFTDRIPQFYWLIPLYIVILVPLLVAIVKLGFHLPTILRGFVFYVQFAPIAAEYLPQTFNLKVPIMACIASSLALYVPYDFSFHSEMSALESYGLRYITPLIAVIVVPIATRVRRLRSKYWHGVWTVILLLYIMLVQTSVSILHCPTFVRSSSNNSRSSVTLWFIDGSVPCYHGWHLFLTIVAVIVLILLALLVPLVAASVYFRTLRRKFQRFERLEPFSLALTHGLKEDYKWWPVVELSCRYIAVVTVVSLPGFKAVPLVVSVMVFVVQFFAHPYKNNIANYSESLVNLMLVIILALGNTTVLISAVGSVKTFTLWPPFYLPVFCGGVVAVIWVIYKVWIFFSSRKDAIKKFLKMKIQSDPDSSPSLFRKLTTSYASRKAWLVHNSNITKTVVTIFDEPQEDEIQLVTANDDGNGEEDDNDPDLVLRKDSTL